MRTRPTGWLAAAVLASSGLVAAAPAASGHDALVVVAGSFQSELGCPGDWDPACEATALPETGPGRHGATLRLPGGEHAMKVTVGGSWAENYGVDGVPGGADIPLVLAGPATLDLAYDDTTHRLTVTPTDLPGAEVAAADRALAGHSLRQPLTRERFYFVMADRFANGDTGNDTGALAGDRMSTGFDPTDKGFYHGGDLAGVIDRLDYVDRLGTTAIWLTPSFENKPVQGTGDAASAGYHGYWVTDFTRIDPHLGTNQEMRRLVRLAHRRGIKVFFDIITNHTADVISYAEGQYGYVSKAAEPYRDAQGNPFDDRDFLGGPDFPPLDAETSFPYTPEVAPEEVDAKKPAWLNDVTLYHNRGNSTYAGESSTYGDFDGLDDLFTEHPRVVRGMQDVYRAWVDFGIDGFRIDTAKHVNLEFWQQFAPAMQQAALADRNPDFFMFGEVFDADPALQSVYSTQGRLPATVDFGFQAQAVAVANGASTTRLADLFAADDYYTDTDSNAYDLPTFLANHDMGRVGRFVGGSLERSVFAHELMYTLRGQPVVYYGDEQGFTGDGGDKDARQDMFASRVASYNDDQVMGGEPGSRDRYGTRGPLYRAIAGLAALREDHPALADGAQLPRYSSRAPGVFAVSRVSRRERREYLVVANNAGTTRTVDLETSTPRSRWVPLYGGGGPLRSDRAGVVTVSVPPLTVRVLRAGDRIDAGTGPPTGHLVLPEAGAALSGRQPVRVTVPSGRFAEVSVGYRLAGEDGWTPLGTDDNAPYRVFHDVTGLHRGTLVEYRAVVRDVRGRLAATSTYGVVGPPPPPVGGPVGEVTQPQSVTVAGDLQSELGCPGDWQPDCAATRLTLDPDDAIWKGTVTLPAGSYAYKVALDGSWDENYGAGAVRNGANIELTSDGGPVRFFYDHRTHLVSTAPPDPLVVATGTFQSEMGCPADTSATCMRSWLQDPDGDGTYTLSTLQVPAGDYEVRAAVGLGAGPAYGQGGVAGGPPVAFTVPRDGLATTFVYDSASHLLTVSAAPPAAGPDLGTSDAYWLDRRTVAYPLDRVPRGFQPGWLRYRLHWGALAVDDTDLGGASARLRLAPGAPAGYVALRLRRSTVAQRPEILGAPMRAVGVYDDAHRLLDATGVRAGP